MRSLILQCSACSTYTLAALCPRCGAKTESPSPPRYSPEDHYGSYRRALMRQQRNQENQSPEQ